MFRNTTIAAIDLLSEQGSDGMTQAMQLLLNECMNIERQQFLGVGPHERSDNRNGHANGCTPKRVKTRIGELDQRVPQVRDARFYSSARKQGTRSEKALRMALAEKYVQGVSTAKVSKILAELGGCHVSSREVRRVAADLHEELDAWRTRPLSRVKYLILDACCERIREAGCVVDCAVLIAIGVDFEGQRSVLGVSVSRNEAEMPWREFFRSLLARGLHGVELICRIVHAGLAEAQGACFTGVPWQLCQFHLQKNACDPAPTEEITHQLSDNPTGIFDAADSTTANEQSSASCGNTRSRAEAGCVDRSTCTGRIDRVSLAAVASPAFATEQHAGATQP